MSATVALKSVLRKNPGFDAPTGFEKAHRE
jgi:hypothetical protein